MSDDPVSTDGQISCVDGVENGVWGFYVQGTGERSEERRVGKECRL